MTCHLGPGTAPDAVDDAVCALEWVVDNAAEYGSDTNQIVVSGGSAGGHLALVTGILGSRDGHPSSPGGAFRVGAVINWYGITDIKAVESYLAQAMPDFNYARIWAGEAARIPALSNRYSPVEIVDEGAPPTLTIHGEADSIVPHDQAVSLHGRLDELGVVHQLHSTPDGTHGASPRSSFRRCSQRSSPFWIRRGWGGEAARPEIQMRVLRRGFRSVVSAGRPPAIDGATPHRGRRHCSSPAVTERGSPR